MLPPGLGHFHHAEFDIACAYAVLRRKADVMTWLRRASADGFPCYPLFQKDPLLAPLRGDPDFERFMAEIGAQFGRYRATA